MTRTSSLPAFCSLLLAGLLAACGNSSAPVGGGGAGVTDNAPPPLSADATPGDIADSRGGGAFGQWRVDRYGLPAYDYSLDQTSDPRARRAELSGSTQAWHQLGNDAIVANAYNDGYVQLWSSLRLYQWVNRYDAANHHYAGGYGYLRSGGQTVSTLWLDRPAGAAALRRFGVGYFERGTQGAGLEITECVTAPFGEATGLVHEVTIHNPGAADRAASWWEYWDVNPAIQAAGRAVPIGLRAPVYDSPQRLLKVAQLADGLDANPLSIFLAAVDAPVDGFDTDAAAVFGNGGRAAPDAVAADHAGNSIAAPALPAIGGGAAFFLRSPIVVPAGGSVRLRYLYGIAHDGDIAALLALARAQADTQAATARAWAGWLPQADFGGDRRWLARELQWDAYQTRSASLYEESCGHHIITQGGYYQYGLGQQEAFRDPLQHALPMIYSAPELAREVLRYSLQQQPPLLGNMSYGMLPLCTRLDFGASDDLDFWLLLTTVEYVLGTRDLAFLDEQVPYRGGLPVQPLGSGSVWQHLQLAVSHQETLVGRGPHGQYLIGPTGDWSDLSPLFLQITESTLVTAQLAYLYPRLAELAALRGDDLYAAQLRAKAADLRAAVAQEWTGLGWYSRGYSGLRQLGSGVIFGEPQPWAILAGIPDARQSATLVGNIDRFLTGIGAPPQLHGPARIGSSMTAAADDPQVTEHSQPEPNGVGDNNAVFVGGAWYAVNGWLTWALGRLDGQVPRAADQAFDELQRNTLAAHAEAYPDSWDGVLNVDDACWSWYSSEPGRCGVGTLIQLGNTAGQVTHQPAWSLFAALKLAGVEPVQDGYRIAPHLPLPQWSLRLPGIGLAQEPGLLRGYVRPQNDGTIRFQVLPRAGQVASNPVAWVQGQRVDATRAADGSAVFIASGKAGQALDWAVRTLP